MTDSTIPPLPIFLISLLNGNEKAKPGHKEHWDKMIPKHFGGIFF